MRETSRARRLGLLAMALLMTVTGLLLGAGPARAEDPVQVMLLLDVSGSMNEKVSSGGTKLAAAKTALKQVADGLPAGTQVGLRVYGSKIKEPKEENPKACQDTELVMPMGPLDRGRMHGTVDSFRAVGETPIAYTLEQSVKDFTGSGRRVVVLVSDGEENCVPDPCPVAKKLAAAGVSLQFNAIGFNVNGKARKQLQCIVDATDGSYYDAEDTQDLTDSLEKLTQRALRPFRFSGTAIKGSTDKSRPTPVRPGQYLDTFDITGDPKYYRIDRTPGFAVSVGLSAILALNADGHADSWELRMETPDGFFCDSDTTGGEGIVSDSTTSGSLTTAGYRDECQAGPLVLMVRRAVWKLEPSRIEFVISEEPPITNLDQLPPPVATVPDAAPVARAKKPVKAIGGLAFTDAPLLEPGSYLEEIAVGETIVYRVRLQPGQRLRATLDAPRPGSDWRLESGFEAVTPRVVLRSPARAELANKYSALMGGARPVRVSAGTPEIRVRNRELVDPILGGGPIPFASIAGDYFVEVSLDGNKTNLVRTLLPVQLNIAIDGEPAGLPVYASPTPSPPSDSTGPATSDPASPGSSGPDSSPGRSGEPSQSQQPGAGGPGIGVAAAVAGGILAVLLVAGAITVVILRRRRGSHS